MLAELGWIGIGIYGLTLIALALLSSVMIGPVRPRLKEHQDLIKRVSVGILVISAGYWWLIVPYERRYYDFSDKLEYRTSGEEVANTGEHLREHLRRIESLERELENQREGSRQLRNHYELVLQLAFFAVLYLSSILIFNKTRS
ncbi:MAG: hypothetical protein ABI857_03495 [Acidobacteriota bacterium]